jgi:hypothetical protein
MRRMCPELKFVSPLLTRVNREETMNANATVDHFQSNRTAKKKCISVGFVSMQLREHSVAKLIEGVITQVKTPQPPDFMPHHCLLFQLSGRDDFCITALFVAQGRHLKEQGRSNIPAAEMGSVSDLLSRGSRSFPAPKASANDRVSQSVRRAVQRSVDIPTDVSAARDM